MIDRTMLHKAARDDLMLFIRLAFGTLYPTKRFKPNWHHEAIAQLLQEGSMSREMREIVTMPPRSLKSFIISIAYPAWLLGRDPTTGIICSTYGEKLSHDQSLTTARLMQSDFYAGVFPGAKVASATKSRITMAAGGFRFATSVGGPTTGFGGDYVIIDDPMNATDAHSANAREATNRYFDRALSSRVDDETSSKFIVVMQRLHENDLAGHLLAKGGWNLLKLQAKATERQEIDIGRYAFKVVEAGDLLDAQRLPQAVLDRKLRDMGSIDFQAQFQQDPVPAQGNIVRRHWLRYYSGVHNPDDARIVISLDTATKTNPENDYSVCTVWVNRPESHTLIDVWRDKVEYPQLKAAILSLHSRYSPTDILIEDHGNGSALIQELRATGIPAIACGTPGSKLSRLISATTYMESGSMWLPSDAPWLAEFEAELLAFNNGKHDDQVDSVSQYFAWVRERGPIGLIVHSLYDPDEPGPKSLWDVIGELPRW